MDKLCGFAKWQTLLTYRATYPLKLQEEPRSGCNGVEVSQEVEEFRLGGWVVVFFLGETGGLDNRIQRRNKYLK